MPLLNDLVRTYDNIRGCVSDNKEPTAGKPSGTAPFMHEYRLKRKVIDITITMDGSITAAKVENDMKEQTLIAVTEASASRASLGADTRPNALNDKLKYMTSGYREVTVKKEDGSKESVLEKGRGRAYDSYVSQLKTWTESPFSCRQAEAVLECVTKEDLIDRLSEWVDLSKKDDDAGPFDRKYLQYFVRWTVLPGTEAADEHPETWRNETVLKSWTQYMTSLTAQGKPPERDVVTGETAVPRALHPKPIRAFGGAKMISTSSQESKILHYTGERFTAPEQLPKIGVETSDSIHSAIAWLTDPKNRQAIYVSKNSLPSGTSKDDPKILVVWCPDKPEAKTEIDIIMGSEYGFPEKEFALYGDQARNLFYRGIENALIGHDVSVCVFEKSTLGRFSPVFYRSFSADEYLKRIKTWHENLAWFRYDRVDGCLKIVPAVIFRIASCAVGTERVNEKGEHYLDVNEKRFSETVFTLMNSMLDGKRIPDNVINAVLDKISNPMCYPALFEEILYSACAVLRHRHIYKNKKKGDDDFMPDSSNRDRSYLYGRLLAVYERIEIKALYRKAKTDDGKNVSIRTTNARKYWAGYESHPLTTRATLERLVNPYLSSLPYKTGEFFKNEIGKIESLFTDEDRADGRRLSPEFIHGYYLERAYLMTFRKTQDSGNEDGEAPGTDDSSDSNLTEN